jgi:AcrR family transcriptional regulator
MPTPDRTSIEEITAAAREILEAEGYSGLTMQAVAERVGVRAPSLDKRVRNRDDLVRLVAEATFRDLGAQLNALPATTDGHKDILELANALRAFGHAQPNAFRIVFGASPTTVPPNLELIAHSVAALLRISADLAGPEQALNAARTFTAWAAGFIIMELGDVFNLGGDVEDAFHYGVTHLALAVHSDRA